MDLITYAQYKLLELEIRLAVLVTRDEHGWLVGNVRLSPGSRRRELRAVPATHRAKFNTLDLGVILVITPKT